jgi:hypothetical protein
VAKSVARGKALVAKLKANPKVRDGEALAAWIGRRKKYKKMGVSDAVASSLAKNRGGSELAREITSTPKPQRPPRPSRRDKGRKLAGTRPASITQKVVNDDDPFSEDYGDNEPLSKEEKQRERYEDQQVRALEKAERSRLHGIIHEAGGLKTRDALREEYAGIPNTFKRKDGASGDEMAEYLATYYPEFGIEDERDLIDYLAA